jgi:hypothetical protein
MQDAFQTLTPFFPPFVTELFTTVEFRPLTERSNRKWW